MPLLTTGEYDDLPDDVKQELSQVVRQPSNNVKSRRYRRWRGKYANGELDADPLSSQTVGYGTGQTGTRPGFPT